MYCSGRTGGTGKMFVPMMKEKVLQRSRVFLPFHSFVRGFFLSRTFSTNILQPSSSKGNEYSFR